MESNFWRPKIGGKDEGNPDHKIGRINKSYRGLKKRLGTIIKGTSEEPLMFVLVMMESTRDDSPKRLSTVILDQGKD